MNDTAPSVFRGGCACGAVRYECSGAPVSMVNCHCRDCQRAGGAGYAPTIVMRRASFAVTKGEPMYFERTCDSGSTAQRAFCGRCGSPLFASSAARQDFVGIRAGSLDDPGWFRPTVDVWTASAQPWDLLHSETMKYEREPNRRGA